MRTGSRSQGRWRKRSKRGVSPIIATILLVAITVVLAAVLYVLISGLTRGPGNTPIGSALATSSATASNPKAGVFNETFSVQSASTGVTALSLKFQLLTSAGAISGTSMVVTLVDVSGCAVAFFNANAWTTSTTGLIPAGAFATANVCTNGLTTTSQVASGDQLIVTTGTSVASAGNSLNIIGAGSYSGTESASIP